MKANEWVILARPLDVIKIVACNGTDALVIDVNTGVVTLWPDLPERPAAQHDGQNTENKPPAE